MTYCTRGEQLFAWQTAYLDTTIYVMNEKSGFMRPGNSFPLIPWSSLDIPGPTVGVVDDDAWSTEAHEWDVFAQSHIQQLPLNYVFRNTCAWTCVILGCQLSHCLAPILLYQAG
ncbi:hypothetical protein AVEN_105898-1 [Araneus ventricosus]|uniref:Uncharacterized protein n=1 Tax=Araneus ventricosus TaxID=182803 RepID=A0A4Y2P6G5_ARAVE|nr:hypothetical protein AVEN_105898-1 [Araneus ventricosus]